VNPLYVWGVALLLWGAFFLWYTNLGGPLTPEEIEHYTQSLASSGEVDPEQRARLLKFLEDDTGGDFLMMNVIEMHEKPIQVEGVRADETSQQVLDRYMAYMWPALLKRACHPVVFGSAAAPAMESWGIDGDGPWTAAAMMRYRSRRDLMEIAATPDFNGPHGFKIAAMKRTIAFPLDPFMQLGDPRLVLGLVLFGVAAGLQLLVR
jgi:hypothetical protein